MKNLLTKVLVWLGLRKPVVVTEISVKTLSSVSAQQVFDFVANHLLRQNQKALQHEICKYRVENSDLKCAAGCLIPDDIYDPKMEGTRYHGLIPKYAFPNEHVYLIEELQSIHDSESVKDWKEQLNILAKKNNLTPIS